MKLVPSKHIPISETLLGVGETLVRCLKRPCTPEQLWRRVRNQENVGTFDRFVEALDFLYATKAVDYENGTLVKARWT